MKNKITPALYNSEQTTNYDCAKWLPERLQKDLSWCYKLKDVQVNEIIEAAKITPDIPINENLDRTLFQLPEFESELKKIYNEISNGLGFIIIR